MRPFPPLSFPLSLCKRRLCCMLPYPRLESPFFAVVVSDVVTPLLTSPHAICSFPPSYLAAYIKAYRVNKLFRRPGKSTLAILAHEAPSHFSLPHVYFQGSGRSRSSLPLLPLLSPSTKSCLCGRCVKWLLSSPLPSLISFHWCQIASREKEKTSARHEGEERLRRRPY